jgi:hypothetical protein
MIMPTWIRLNRLLARWEEDQAEICDRIKKSLQDKDEKVDCDRVTQFWDGEPISVRVILASPGRSAPTIHLVSGDSWLAGLRLTVTDLNTRTQVASFDLGTRNEILAAPIPDPNQHPGAHIRPSDGVMTDPPIQLSELPGGLVDKHAYKIEIFADPAYAKKIKPKTVTLSTDTRHFFFRKPATNRERGILLFHLGRRMVEWDPQAAEKLLLEALSIDKTLQTPRDVLASMYVHQKRYDEAIKMLEAWKAQASERQLKSIDRHLRHIESRRRSDKRMQQMQEMMERTRYPVVRPPH